MIATIAAYIQLGGTRSLQGFSSPIPKNEIERMQTMKNARTLYLAGCMLASLAMGGCAALDRMERENYQHACDNLGITRGTPAYDQCMLQQQAMENANTQKFMDREAYKHRH